MTGNEKNKSGDEFHLLSKEIFYLIFEKRFDEAKLLIHKEKMRSPDDQSHRLTALSALLHASLGEADKSIALMKLALRENPTWLPHLYRLSVMQMDAEQWSDADLVLGELIALSLEKDDVYFLGEGRVRKALCLSMLGRTNDLQQLKTEISAGEGAFIGEKWIRIEDIQ